jgi:hypothetical protein
VAVPRCDLLSEDCIAEHIAPLLGGRCVSAAEQWSAFCPAHADRQKRSLRIVKGDRQRIVWMCHAGCSASAVKTAMLKLGIPAGCITWRPAEEARDVDGTRNADIVAEITKLIVDQPPAAEFMIRVTELIHGVDGRTAAKIAGISQATYYRHRRPK